MQKSSLQFKWFTLAEINFSGRRIIYDFDKFGDSPTCLGQVGEKLDGKEALLEGYGLNENGKIKHGCDYVPL